MIFETEFKKCKCIQMENSVLRVIVLPELGGKIASIFRKDKDFELLFQNKEDSYRKPKIYDSFEEFDASGFDDAFPNIDCSSIIYEGKEVLYPDHGEIWSAAFDYSIQDSKVILNYKSRLFQYTYKKIISLEGDHIIIDYTISNVGAEKIPCIWTMHCLIHCEEDMELIFPRNTKEVENIHQSRYLGSIGTIHQFPETHTSDGSPYRLDRVMSKSLNKAEKYYVKGSVYEGMCGAYYPSKSVTFKVRYDKSKLPYLGFWITEGGFRGDYNCALEPTNGYYDCIAIAKRNNAIFELERGETLSFSINMDLK